MRYIKRMLFAILTILVLLFTAAVQAETPADAAAFRTVENVVTFGHYEQDNNTENGPEAIEWIVLDYDEKENKALLLSKYGLDAKAYNSKSSFHNTWESCAIRNWLNNEFLLSAFSAEEQAAVLTMAVDNSTSQGYWETEGGIDTQDQVFLLSYAEANRYLGVTREGNNTKARVSPTAYAIAQGASVDKSYQTDDGEPAGWWWLRSPGGRLPDASNVSSDGLLDSDYTANDRGVVRPALWINLESEIFK